MSLSPAGDPRIAEDVTGDVDIEGLDLHAAATVAAIAAGVDSPKDSRMPPAAPVRRSPLLASVFIDDEALSTSDDSDAPPRRGLTRLKNNKRRRFEESDTDDAADVANAPPAADDDYNDDDMDSYQLGDFVVADDAEDSNSDSDGSDDDGGNDSSSGDDDGDAAPKHAQRRRRPARPTKTFIGRLSLYDVNDDGDDDGVLRMYAVAMVHLHRRLTSADARSMQRHAAADLGAVSTALAVALGENDATTLRFADAAERYRRFYRQRSRWSAMDRSRWVSAGLPPVLRGMERIRCEPHERGVARLEPAFVDARTGAFCRRWVPRYVVDADELSDDEDADGNRAAPLSTLPVARCVACRTRRPCTLVAVLWQPVVSGGGADADAAPYVEAAMPCTERCYEALRLQHRVYHHERRTARNMLRQLSAIDVRRLSPLAETAAKAARVVDYRNVSTAATVLAVAAAADVAAGDRRWARCAADARRIFDVDTFGPPPPAPTATQLMATDTDTEQ